MKRIAVLLIGAAFLVIFLAGCGGGETVSGESTVSPSAAASTASAANEPVLTVPRVFEKTPQTPAFFIEALNKNMPIFVLFYEEDELSQNVIREVNKLIDDKYFADGATFLLMKVDENEQVKKLQSEFSIDYVPYIAVINRSGKIIYEKKGYVDSQVLKQALYDAMNKI